MKSGAKQTKQQLSKEGRKPASQQTVRQVTARRYDTDVAISAISVVVVDIELLFRFVLKVGL